LSHFLPLLNEASFFEAVAKIGFSLKPNYQNQVNQVKIVQIPEIHCTLLSTFQNQFEFAEFSQHLKLHFFRRSPGLLEKANSGSNLAAITRYMWIRVALFEKKLQRIVAYLVEEADK
jgi:hypothetical protein